MTHRDPPNSGKPARAPRAFRFAVDAGKIREFVDALADRRTGPNAKRPARARASGATLAPIAFTRSSMLQEPAGSSMAALLRVDPSHMRHAGHRWRIATPLRAGDVLRVTGWRIVGEEKKRGRSGARLRFVTAERRFTTLSGTHRLLERMRTVIVGPGRPVERPPANPRAQGAFGRRTRFAARDWTRAKTGATLARASFGPIGRTEIVRFAGAIGDFTPIHHDLEAARRAGLPDVIAMGMLPVALVLSVIEARYGIERIVEVDVRFHHPLPAGSRLEVSVVAGGRSSAGGPRCSFIATTAAGDPVLTGAVLARGSTRARP